MPTNRNIPNEYVSLFFRIRNLIQNNIKPGSNLVYFASGARVKPEYFDLAYDNIFLIDTAFKQSSYQDEKVFCLSMDCMIAVYIFRRLNIQIHCFVCINEGLNEGGGLYPINGDIFLGYCLPILDDPFIHIGSKEYYQGSKKLYHYYSNYLNLPFKRIKELNDTSPESINTSLFSDYWNGDIFMLSGKLCTSTIVSSDKLNITLKYDSIWSDIDELDAVFTRTSGTYDRDILKSLYQKVFFMNRGFHNDHNPQEYSTVEDIIEICENNEFKKIGIVPIGGSYLQQLAVLKQKSNGFPMDLTYYHLNKDDYRELYDLAESDKLV